MRKVSRRVFLGATLGTVAVLQSSPSVFAAAQCVTAPFPPFLPNRLTVDCASRINFRLFRDNTIYLGLAGAVSMSFVRGKRGSYAAGNLFLFPWLKPKGVALGQTRVWNAQMPLDATRVAQASPIPNAALPLDEYFCRLVLQAPWTPFIGFLVDEPHSKADARLDWFGNLDRLADGKGVGIDWTSPNLNHPWFGGSPVIPNTDDCYGRAWRLLIADGLMQASVGAC